VKKGKGGGKSNVKKRCRRWGKVLVWKRIKMKRENVKRTGHEDLTAAHGGGPRSPREWRGGESINRMGGKETNESNPSKKKR